MTSRPHKAVRSSVRHDSADRHVDGSALYVDDIAQPSNLLHAYVGFSEIAHGKLLGMDLDKVRSSNGVESVISSADIPGPNDVSPMHNGDEGIFAETDIEFLGQPLFAVAATSRMAARKAAKRAIISTEKHPALLDIQSALDADSYAVEPHIMSRGDADGAIAAARHQLEGEFAIGGQDHFYLEGQVSLAIPLEGGDLLIQTSSQHPSEVQELVAQALGKASNAVTVEVRRMGGAFGGKETQAAQWAIIAALLAVKTGKPVKLRLDRDDDMQSTGKRHDFIIRYHAGFDDDGRLEGIRFFHATRCGMSADLSGPIADRAMFHSDNAYYLPNVTIESYRAKTHTVSNTAFRGFGGPQGMMGIERVMDDIAFQLGLDPVDVRSANFYGEGERNVTPYHMIVEDNVIEPVVEDLLSRSQYRSRRKQIEQFNRDSRIIKRGIALTPVKFGISFTTTFLNQAGALVHVYKDGSIHLNHGGTEMGQGLMTKVSQVVADEFGVDLSQVKISATNTSKVPNTTATAASAGSDMNGMAARNACITIRDRLAEMLAQEHSVAPETIKFRNGKVEAGSANYGFAEVVQKAWMARISLSSTGFYRTPKIHYDRDTASGRPFLYFAYGAAVSEVEIDTLTGEHQLLRVDIVHDVGQSLNPAIDLGQIEGGFVQGMGWLTTEELWWDDKGKLRTHAPSTYKIPTCGDIPEQFNAHLWSEGRNREETIHRSKAVGEPPLMLAISVHSALCQAVTAARGDGLLARLDAPATPEQVLLAIDRNGED